MTLTLSATGALFDHEEVLIRSGKRSGLVITVAVHSTVLGPAFGGARLWQYPTWIEGVEDALRLSAAMTLKNAAAGLDWGGGKSTISVPSGQTLTAERRQAALLDLGDAVAEVDGRYFTAEDVGTTEDDMALLAQRTSYVLGLPQANGGTGEPSGFTALGVFSGIRSALDQVYGSADPDGHSVVIAGFGQVGSRLATLLDEAGARVSVSDINPARRLDAESRGFTWLNPEQALRAEADVLAPAGVGGVITPDVIDALRVRIVAGPANNPLSDRSGAADLAGRGILYAPDFLINAGGVIHIAAAEEHLTFGEQEERGRGIEQTLSAVFADAAASGVTPLEAAEHLAYERIEQARDLQRV